MCKYTHITHSTLTPWSTRQRLRREQIVRSRQQGKKKAQEAIPFLFISPIEAPKRLFTRLQTVLHCRPFRKRKHSMREERGGKQQPALRARQLTPCTEGARINTDYIYPHIWQTGMHRTRWYTLAESQLGM